MLAKVCSAAVNGIEAYPIEVQSVDVTLLAIPSPVDV